jgi:hypothetical protein
MVQKFEFEVLTVDSRGEVYGRSRRTAAGFTQDLGGGVALETEVIPEGAFRMDSRPCCTRSLPENLLKPPSRGCFSPPRGRGLEQS